jgi:hypothetical protein
VARSINLDSYPIFETDEVDDVVAERNLPLKLCSLASTIPNSAPDDGFGLNSLRALFARETEKQGFRDFSRHRTGFDSKFRVLNIRSRLAALAPLIPLASLGTFPRKGGRGSRRPIRMRTVKFSLRNLHDPKPKT